MGGLPGRLSALGGPLILGDLKLAALAAVLGLEAVDLIQGIDTGELKSLQDLPGFLEKQLEGAVQGAEQQLGKPLWELLVAGPAGLDPTTIESGQAADAVHMVQRMLGFGLALPILTARLETLVKGILGDHAPEGLLESIRRLPEEIGVNFFIGTVLERIFETAVATPLEEAIAQQTHPARFDFRVIKALLTKHHIKRVDAEGYLQRIGYREQDIALILDLAESFLSVADLQELWLLGSWTTDQVTAYLETLGYSTADAAALVELYLVKAETQGSQQLRATARAGYLEGKIPESEYRQLLASVDTPERSVELEVKSANLQLEWGRRQLTVLNVKQLHQLGHINDRQAELQLERIGFDQADALQLLDTWTVEKRTTHAGLTVNRILGYQLGGVITRARSLELLMETGMKPEDASLLVANPGHLGGIYAHERTPATVVSALKEGLLSVEDASALLDQLGVDPAERDLQLQLTVAKAVRGTKPRLAHRAVGEAQVLEALKLGLATSGWAESELVSLGYTDADAQLLVAIEVTKISNAPPDGWQTLT